MEDFLKKFSDVPSGFIEDFFELSKESYEDDDFAIDLHIVAEWLHVTKGNLKRLLVQHFEKDYDYIINQIKRKNIAGKGANYVEIIFITPDCFKELCMLSQTAKAKEVRKYYLSIEKLIRRYHQSIQDKLYKQLGILKTNQRPKNFKNGGVVYILKALNSEIDLYKIGKSKNLKKRLRQYNSGNANDIEPMFILQVSDIDRVEECIKTLIKKFKYRKYKEVYEINFDILKQVFTRCSDFISSSDKMLTRKQVQKLKNNQPGLFAYVTRL